MGNKKPNGYWQSWENFKSELLPVIEKLGHFPSMHELESLGKKSIFYSYKYHGGVNHIRENMGYDLTRKPKDYWQNWNNILAELQPIIDDLGHFPSGIELRKLNKGMVEHAFKYHGGVNKIKRKLDFIVGQSSDYFKDWNNLKKELQIIINKLSHFPSDRKLRELKMNQISRSISKYHGGFSAVRKKMGYKPLERPKGYWQNWNNFEKELQPIIDQLGHFPTQQDLKNFNFQAIIQTFKYHGGVNTVRNKMGYKPIRKTKGYWEDWDNFEKELQPIIEQLGHFPTQQEVYKFKKSSINRAISQYHRGLEAVKQKMGYSETQQLENLLEDYIGGEKNG